MSGAREGTVLDANNHRGRFAEHYVRTLAAAAGLLVETSDWDDGIDMTIRPPDGSAPVAGSRIDVQVKSWSSPEKPGAFYAYDGLDQVQYNQLAVPDSLVYRFLFLVRVPEDVAELAHSYSMGTLLRYHGYYHSLRGFERFTQPDRKLHKRVHVPKANVLTVRTLRGLLELESKPGTAAGRENMS